MIRHVRRNAALLRNCVILGLALGGLAAVMGPVRYTATALISMSTSPEQAKADAVILQSPPVLRAAALQTEPAAAPTAMRAAAALADLSRRLKVTVEPGTDLVRIALSDPDRARSIAAVRTLIEAARSQRRALADPPVAAASSGLPQASADLERLAQSLRDMDGQIQSIQLRAGGDIAQDTRAAASVDNGLTYKIQQLQDRLRGLDRQLDVARDRMDANESQVFKMTTAGALVAQKSAGGDVKALAASVSALGVERSSVADQLRDLQDQQAESRIHVGDLRQTQSQLAELQRARDALALAYRQAQDQATAKQRDARMASHAAGIHILQQPSVTAGRVFNPLWVLAGLLAGLGCAAGVVLARVLGRRVRNARLRAAQARHVPILAELSPIDGETAGVAGMQKISRLAAALVASNDADHPMSFLQVSGPGEGEDKVALALLLGSEFAEAWRLSTLVIDLGGEARQELSYGASHVQSVTIGGVELEMLTTQYPNIWAITCAGGSASPFSNPHFSLDQVEEALVAMRDKFQRVIMIAPQDFGGKGAGRLNTLADAHLLVVRSGNSRARMLERLRSAIATSGGHILGLVHTHSSEPISAAVDDWFRDVPPPEPAEAPRPLALSHFPEAPALAAE